LKTARLRTIRRLLLLHLAEMPTEETREMAEMAVTEAMPKEA
jgi:hypothetical protein